MQLSNPITQLRNRAFRLSPAAFVALGIGALGIFPSAAFAVGPSANSFNVVNQIHGITVKDLSKEIFIDPNDGFLHRPKQAGDQYTILMNSDPTQNYYYFLGDATHTKHYIDKIWGVYQFYGVSQSVNPFVGVNPNSAPNGWQEWTMPGGQSGANKTGEVAYGWSDQTKNNVLVSDPPATVANLSLTPFTWGKSGTANMFFGFDIFSSNTPGSTQSVTLKIVVIPEPAFLQLGMLVGLGGLALARRRLRGRRTAPLTAVMA